jgi:hypothetical protein
VLSVCATRLLHMIRTGKKTIAFIRVTPICLV